jgi:hypothetical protein
LELRAKDQLLRLADAARRENTMGRWGKLEDMVKHMGVSMGDQWLDGLQWKIPI